MSNLCTLCVARTVIDYAEANAALIARYTAMYSSVTLIARYTAMYSSVTLITIPQCIVW